MSSFSLRSALRLEADFWETHVTTIRLWVYVALAMILCGVTAQRSLMPQYWHWTFPIFRASYHHLVQQENLYARYKEHDLFKYSPTVALLFAPFSIAPFVTSLLCWNALNMVALVYAINRLCGVEAGTLAIVLVSPEIFTSMQASQSNSLVAALIVLAFLALERDEQLRGYLAIATGAAIKLFPLAALSFAIFHPRRVRAALIFTVCAIALVALPLLVTSPSMLITQYGWWRDVESVDSFKRGASVMRALHQALGVRWPNWPVQLAGTLILLLPLAHRNRWRDPQFRRAFLASLLVFMVIFNHQAERPSFVIAATGVALWYTDSTRDYWRLALVLFSLTGLYAWGYLPVWILMQWELHQLPSPASLTGARGIRVYATE